MLSDDWFEFLNIRGFRHDLNRYYSSNVYVVNLYTLF